MSISGIQGATPILPGQSYAGSTLPEKPDGAAGPGDQISLTGERKMHDISRAYVDAVFSNPAIGELVTQGPVTNIAVMNRVLKRADAATVSVEGKGENTFFSRHGSFEGGDLLLGQSQHLMRIDEESGRPLWDITFDGNFSMHFAQTLKNGDVLANYKCSLYRIDGQTGKIKWEREFGNFESLRRSEQAMPDGPLYTFIEKLGLRPPGEGDPGTLVALDLDTGKDIETFRKMAGVSSTSLDVKGAIYFRSGDEVGAARLDGRELFRVPVKKASFSTMQFDAEGNAFVTGDKRTCALSKDGAVLWESPISKDVTLRPTDPDRIYLGSNTKTYVKDKKTGQDLWNTKSRIVDVRNNRVLLQEGRTLSCVDAATGNPKWTENKSESPSIISIGADDTLYTSQKLYSSNGNTVVEALDPSTGKAKWSVDLGQDNGFTHAALTPDGTLLVSGEHCIWGIDTKDGKVKSAIGFKPEGYITDLTLNSEGTGFFIDDMNNGLQFFSLNDLVDLREEEEKIKREIIEEASTEPTERSSGRVGITEDEEFVEIDGMFLRRNL
jgi:outer membrane protein assembly factor BamB